MDAELELSSTRDEIGKHINVRTEVYALDEWYSSSPLAGRSDLKARRKVGALNDTQDLEGTLRKLAPNAGAYYVQSVAGRDVIDSDVFHIQPKGQKLEIESSRGQVTTGATPAAPLAPSNSPAPAEQSSAQSINATTETIRATKELLREVQPSPSAAPSPADILKMITDAVRDAVAQTQPAASPVDPFSFVERSMTLQEQMRRQAMASNPAPQQQAATPDAAESFLSQFEKFTEISERINPIRERDNAERGWFDKVLGTVEGIAKSAPALAQFAPLIAGMMPGRIGAMMESAGVTDAPPLGAPMPPQQPAQATQAAPAQPAQPQNETEAMILIAHIAVADMTRGKRPGRLADVVEEQLISFPQLRKAVNELCEMPPEQVLATIQQLTGRGDLRSYATSLFYIENLQDELRPDGEGDDPDGGETQSGGANIIEMAQTARAS
jgi:hypothetical protein